MDGAFKDRPPPRPDDWAEEARQPHVALTPSWSELLSSNGEDDSGLKRQPAWTPEPATRPEPDRTPDAGLLDDDFDTADTRHQSGHANDNATVRRAYALDQSDEDLIPKF